MALYLGLLLIAAGPLAGFLIALVIEESTFMTTYNGHKNWTHWNVSLWIANDEPIYRMAMDIVKRETTLGNAARRLKRCLPDKTPDGARYSLTAIRAALRGLQS